MPTVSVIIPSYNHAQYIEEAINSVLNQKFTDLELIIIDDASQDHSWELIESFNDVRITSIQHKENQGADQTINQGLSLAKGDYLTILNSDDSYHPDRLEQLTSIKKDFIATDLQLWDKHSKNKESQEEDWVNWFENLKENYQKTGDFLATLLQGNFLITTSNFFFSRKLYQQLKGFKGLRYVHDYEFAIRALFADVKVEYLPKKLLNYRLHDSNTIREAPLKAIQENVSLLLSLTKAFSEKFVENPQYLVSLTQHVSELYQYTNEEWKTKNHYKLLNKEKELFNLIHDRDRWIKERNQWISERDGKIEERNQWLVDRDKYIEALDNQIKEYVRKFNQLELGLTEKQHIIATQESWVADRDTWIEERNTIIEQQKKWLNDRDTWIKERDHTIQTLNTEVQSLRNSRSYRLGQLFLLPIRPLKKIMKESNMSKPVNLSVRNLAEFRAYLQPKLKQTKIISFDIFDTLLARCIESPEEIQQATCRIIAKHLAGKWTTSELLSLRQQAEQTLRQESLERGLDHECSYMELCILWSERILGRYDRALAKKMRDTEFELENTALYVKDDVIELLEWLKGQPIKLIAISDMYLDSGFIESLLKEKGLLDYFDDVYVSSDSKQGKYTGHLFQQVQQEQNLQTEHWIHIGDNPVSDRREACKIGIQGIWLYEKAEIKRRKQQTLSAKMAKKGGTWKGRFFFEAVAQRAAQNTQKTAFFYQYGIQVLGAAFSTFNHALLERLDKKPVDKVFFLARDGYLFHQLFKSTSTQESEYIYMSRRVITAAAMAEGLTHQQAIVAFYNPKQQGLHSVFKVYDLPSERLEGLAKSHGFTTLKQPIKNWSDKRLLNFLGDKTVQNIIREHGNESRKLLERYLEQVGFFACKAAAFVDIGWNGTIQKFLKQAFGYRKDFPILYGYYFAFVPKLYNDFGDNNFCEGIIHDSRRDNACERIPAEVEEIFEQGARSQEGTTLAYQWQGDRVIPVLKTDAAKDRQAEIQCNPWILEMQQGILDHYQHYQAIQKITGYSSNEIMPYVHGLLERAVVYPTKQESQQLTQLVHTEDFGHDDVLDIGKKAIGLRDLLKPIKLIRKIEITAWRYALFANIPTSIANFIFRVFFLHAVKK